MTSRCPASPHCPYCDADTSEQEELEYEANMHALIEAHARPQSDEDREQAVTTTQLTVCNPDPLKDLAA